MLKKFLEGNQEPTRGEESETRRARNAESERRSACAGLAPVRWPIIVQIGDCANISIIYKAIGISGATVLATLK
jgi:hypothetical protein